MTEQHDQREVFSIAHTQFAKLLLNSLLVFIAINIVVAGIGFVSGSVAAQPEEPINNDDTLTVYWLGSLSTDFSILQEIYYYRPSSEIIWMLLETANLNNECDDRTMFRVSPYRGTYVNVDEAGFRYGANQAPWPPLDDNLNIFVFGGSAAFGYGESDEYHIGSQLQAQLREAMGTDKIALYNFGRMFYISLQERLLFESLIDDGYVPDIAIFLTGVNDFFYWNGEPADYSNCDRPPSQAERWNKTITCQFDELCMPVQKLASDVLEDDSPTNENVWGTIDFRLRASTPPADDEATLRAIIARWIDNKTHIETTAQQAGIDVLIAMQPAPFYAHNLEKNLFYDSIEDFDLEQQRIHWGYQMWDEMAADPDATWMGNVVNLLHLGENPDEPIYLDSNHYTIDFTAQIAAALQDELLRRGIVE